MPRRIAGMDEPKTETKQELREATPDEEAAAATTGIPGGAPGIIVQARTTIAMPPAQREAAVDVGGAGAQVERYRVGGPGPWKDGTWPILYGGVRVFLRPGKEVSSATYDLRSLRSQGVKLEPIT